MMCVLNHPSYQSTVDDPEEVSTCPEKRRCRVSFAESSQVHQYEGVREDERDLVWFTPEELTAANQHTASLVAALIRDSVNPNSWSSSVLRMYRAFRANCSKPELMEILSSSNVYFDEHTIGLEGLAIPVICRDFSVRRRHLMDHVQRYQNMSLPDDATREKLICNVSTSTSHVSRSFAILMAHLIIEENENEKEGRVVAEKL
mmetsp:Transcript_9578/g.18454  ORF Transcript_9578/g.18454 Transcript_9578/m.18454 type:complete len:203 (+) Transcript_9578:65-673(+)